jgi:hypothetical protein
MDLEKNAWLLALVSKMNCTQKMRLILIINTPRHIPWTIAQKAKKP